MIAERLYFYSRNQKPTESVAEYVAELRRFATHCEFGDGPNDALRDRLVCGLRNHGLQQRLLTEAGLTLAKAVEIAQGQEAAAQNLKKLRSASEGISLSVPNRCNFATLLGWRKRREIFLTLNSCVPVFLAINRCALVLFCSK